MTPQTNEKTRKDEDYPFEVRPLSDEEGGGYVITYPDLPGCMSDGETPEEAVENGRDAVAGWLAISREFGDEIPEPFSGASGRFVQRLPKSLHAQLIKQAEAESVSLNTLIVTILAQGLGGRTASTPEKDTKTRKRK